MEGSSGSGWQRSDSIRGANSSSFSDRNPRIPRGTNVRSSGDNASHDSGFLPARKGRDRTTILPQISSSRTRVEEGETGPAREIEASDVSLRQWLDNPGRKIDALECLHIFSQVAEIVNVAHSQGIVVHNVRPSCFVMSSLNRVSFIESASCSGSGSGSESPEDGSDEQTAELKGFDSSMPCDSYTNHHQVASGNERVRDDQKHSFPMKRILLMESSWYTSPEEVSGGACSCASDVYQLGVLLFELFCTFGSVEEKSTTMANLRHRVLPPQLLRKWPKEASFCLWLLHPEPSNRPKMSELLQSEFLNEPKDDIEEREAAIELREKIEEQELLLEFLLRLQQRKQEAADILSETISIVSSDTDEVTKLQETLRIKGKPGLDSSKNPALHPQEDEDDSGFLGSRKRVRKPEESEGPGDEIPSIERSILSQNPRLMKNFRKLESAYFLARRRAAKPVQRPSKGQSRISSGGRGSITASERSLISNASLRRNEQKPTFWISTFLEGLCKYLSYSKMEVKADLQQGDLLNSSNIVCSLSFDRDGEFFATAGVTKKIKIFDCNSILKEPRDIHYPAVEMASGSKLSSICWNGYIKSQIASSNFEGTVQVWDVSRSQVFKEMREHSRRVWSVDFSLADPTMLASGSDDGSVKLWNINQGTSVGTIKTKANVCCVQFPADSGRSLAFGSADHKIYYYDLRNIKMPLCTLVGHNKTVSYVRFVDSTSLVSASTDNTLKLWDLSMCTSQVLDRPLQSYTGHVNVKNFVGLSASDGYIATGSETNEVFVYHKAFSMPVLSFKFDPSSGDDVDGSTQFISSVCWRGQSTTLVAANSTGNIKLLEMA